MLTSIPWAIWSRVSPFARVYAAAMATSTFSTHRFSSPRLSSSVLPWFWVFIVASSSVLRSSASFSL